MSDLAVLDNPADRRRHMRRSVYRSAELVLQGGLDGVGCTVLDESEGGVQVELDKALDLPERAIIKFSDMASQLVRRCWAKGNRAGYQYVELEPAESSWLPGHDLSAEARAEPRSAQVRFTSFNDYVQISRALLDLSVEPVEWLYPADQIHAMLSAAPYAWQEFEGGFPASVEVTVEDQNFFGPLWMK